MLDLRQSPNHAKFLKSVGWIVETKNGTNYFIKKIPLIGSFIKIQRPEIINFEDVEKLRKKYRTFHIVIEPKLRILISEDNHSLLYTHGFKLSKSPYLPTKTIWLDLSKPKNQLLKEMHSKTRYNIKKGQKLKVIIQKSGDIKRFIRLYHQWHRRRLSFLSQAKQIREMYQAYGNNADLFFAYKDGLPVSVLLTVRYSLISYYMFAASSSLGKKLFAPTLLTWEAIKDAKKDGCTIFDFEGIYDERFPIKSWQGFSRFKKSFGGQEIAYPGCYTNYRFPL